MMKHHAKRNLSYDEGASSLSAAGVKAASSVWKLFHKKPAPRELIKVKILWPTKWEYAGEAVTTYYNSDKWEDDGKFTKYFHDHEGHNISIWHPAGMFDWTTAAPKPPRFKYPPAVAVLGFSLGVDVKRHDGEKMRKAIPERDSYLVAAPDRKHLWIVEPAQGITAMIAGPGLIVEARGIVG